MRVSAPTDELDLPAAAGGAARRPGRGRGSEEAASGITRLRLERARTIASSLDVRGARVEEALEIVGRYLEDGALAGLERATIIHGLGRARCGTPCAPRRRHTRWCAPSARASGAKAATARRS